jgi:small subunit ribosomal protein S1
MGKPTDVTALEQAREAGLAVEGKVTGVNKGGLEVQIAGTRAFCPSSQVENRFVQDLTAFVGKSLHFLVTEIKEGGRSVTLSRRRLLEREARENAARVMVDIKPGANVRGTITGVRDFGAFVDLGGVEGMIPASEIAHDRSVSVASAVNVGDVVDVQVREIKEVPSKRAGEPPETKITLSLKALAADPWEGIDGVLTAGRVARGTVTRVVEFGAFVKLTAGVEGLLHKSEIGARATMPKPGETIDVIVQSIDKSAKKISLVPAPDGFAVGAAVPETKVAVGAIVSGTVDRIETYGVFVQIEGTKGRAGRGLIPNAELGVPRGTDVRKTFPEGTKVTAKVVDTAEGKIRMSIRAAKDDAERADFDGFREKAKGPAKLGTLGDLLQKKLGKK